jgi:hypothetical protein
MMRDTHGGAAPRIRDTRGVYGTAFQVKDVWRLAVAMTLAYPILLLDFRVDIVL